MRKVILMLLFLQTNVYCQFNILPSAAKYQEILNEVKKKDEILSLEYWKDKNLMKNKETVKFSELTKNQQVVFVLLKAESTSKDMTLLEEMWKLDLTQTVETAKPLFSVSKKELNELLKELYVFRQKFALKYEQFAEKSLLETSLNKKEIDFKLFQIKENHAKLKLTEKAR